MKLYFSLLFILLFPGAVFGADLVFMVLDHNSYIATQAVNHLDLPLDIQVITADDVTRQPDAMAAIIDESSLLVIDIMGRELESFLSQQSGIESKIIYTLRGSLDDESLKKKGFRFDPDVSVYYRYLSVENIENMLRLVIHRHMDKTMSFAPVVKRPDLGLYHPDTGKIFTDADDFWAWQKKRPSFDPEKPKIGFLFFSSFLTQGQKKPVDYIIQSLESHGFLVMPCYGRDQRIVQSFLLDPQGKARVDMVLAFSFKFYNALTPELGAALKKLDVPIFNAVSLYKKSHEEWRKSPVGIDNLTVSWSLAAPELSGLVEPTVLAAKEKIRDPETGRNYFLNRPVVENMDRIIPRLKNWNRLQKMPNDQKRIALVFYNHHQGKQNIGASYLNVFRSIEEILTALRKKGYQAGSPLSETDIKDMILKSARNIGSWAPGELDKLISSGRGIRLPIERYKDWFEALPGDFKEKVRDQWGEPEESGIMKSGRDFIIPAVKIGNMVLLPEPARGWGDDPMKLYHDTTLYPHHQYLAVYLWLQKEFKADAMIHLGTHSTYEWTPGKQSGLSPSCPPEVLITDIPNLYPYIVDDVGEGIMAKRRGRGVMISHLTPTLRSSDLHEEYSRMAELVNDIERAESRGSITAEEKRKELLELAGTTGILEDLKSESIAGKPGYSHDKQEPDSRDLAGDPEPTGDHDHEDTVHLLGHYLEEIKAEMIPFGMHTFGRSPGPEETAEMETSIQKWNPEIDPARLSEDLAQSGIREINSLIRGLDGRFVPPGPGNDPVRNPEALPTGRNFYGLNPGKLPSKAAWELGKKAAREIIANHIKKQNGYPQKVAVILWATETLRNEGVNESTILYLIGTRPRWSKTGRVLGLELIPSGELNRPRIDVMINTSGLYRDLFPEKMIYLDKAIDLAARQTDVENLIARHNREMKTRLINQGMDPEKAEEMSRFRIFSEPPGAYGNGVSEMAGGSSKWDNPDQVVDVFENRTGFGFSQKRWGLQAGRSFKENLSRVDVTVHSRSSNVYGLMDNDDMFQYLGGLSMAVRKESGKTPETLITRQQNKGRVEVEDLGKALGREMRTRYLNPKWIQGMKAEDYAGAKAMSDFVEYLWGWNMTTPEKVDGAKWQQTYEVYVKDKYGLELKQFFNQASPWAFQSITGRMLETHRKGYWKPDRKVLETMAAEYAKSVIDKGVACCDHTCNNPLLNQMVVSIISIPGVLSPDLVEKFRLAVEQAAKKSLDEQVRDQKDLIQKLLAPAPEKSAQADPGKDKTDENMVEGYKMEKMDKKEDVTQMTSSGIEWMAVIFILAIMGLTALGAGKRKF
ncbi:cobaltochelatase subunit CobN [Desulfospira joergensenii]|uniref:cobaltochelatase subunit CobN n=1 Tax=Desulfospira joergensenii TaxID=53329 RepID=UPI0003B6DE1C|nr:cobaltochelatase subunit CobN [Desulfospira joergensenii]